MLPCTAVSCQQGKVLWWKHLVSWACQLHLAGTLYSLRLMPAANVEG